MRHARSVRTLALTATGGLAAGCSGGVQSALDPAGPAAERIALLAWVLFGLCGLIFLAVLLATWLAIRGPPAVRARLAGTGTVWVGGIALPIFTLTGLLGYGVWLTHAGVALRGGVPFRVEVVGEQWWWRVIYLNEDGQRIASANEIRIPVGVPVEFTLKSADVIHSFWVPALGGKVDMVPGHTTRLRVMADRAGIFRGQCAEYCGGPHALMALEVVAMPPEEHRQWLHDEAAAAAEPQSDAARQGRSLFQGAGCGACHAIRGTDAAGTIGPDLTHVGSRRSLAGVTLPNDKASLIRWIRDNQHVKPENLMLPYRNFTQTEIDALATYLAGLK
jgi:cytochrome c oxidase subunit II